MTKTRILGLAGVSILVLASALALPPLRHYRDESAVIGEVLRLEGYLRSHDARTWFFVERNDSAEHPDAKLEALHRAWLEDLERLSHVKAFAMANVALQVSGDEAVVHFDVRGTAGDGLPAPPAGGELRFRRQPDGTWRLAGERLFD